MTIPLAWKNLTHSPRRLAISVTGIAFAVFLMFIEFGFQNALIDSTVEVVNQMQGDIVMVSSARYALPATERFERRRLLQARSIADIHDAHPIYIENLGGVIKKVDENGNPIRVVAYRLGAQVFTPEFIADFESRLRRPQTAIIDDKSKRKYGIGDFRTDALKAEVIELANQQLELVGAFTMGTDFANDGNLIMSAENFGRYFPYAMNGGDPLDDVDLGLLQVCSPRDTATRAEIEQALQRLKEQLPKDVTVMTRKAFMERERSFWNNATPVGYIFTVGVIMGFIVGIIICYQIIFADINDHLSELATMKAMGYPNRYFVRFVITEALYLAIFGFVPGLLFSIVAFGALASWTGLLLRLTVTRAVVVFLLTAVMCIVSGCLSVRRVLSMDPAELF